ncbi:MAG: PKD domain-containing protein [Lutibacter sp.]|uniref:PKD domain-containing protein n=1 Tax=Lutibacter sp. TaxID=1925666 RepID=UPI0017AC614B|nr:PKD domain-containing protein [Lutibacter sp.]MBT8316050.1 PKD domain-containing protein [Lutibacter sp.]NNJ56910.1 PKD domain-containing protein [Lutibacter sp.]
MKDQLNIFKNTIIMVLSVSVLMFSVSCEEAFEFDLPEAGSIEDTVLPTANFAYIPNAVNFKKIEFNNLSTESIRYEWDFGEGNTSTDKDPSFTFEAGEGIYPVTLTAIDGNNASTTVTIDVEVVDKFVPIPVTILNGDMSDGQNDWKFSTFTGGTTSPFNSSSDGSFTNYDGTDNGSKTAGAKWTKSTSAGAYLSSNTRYAYQAIIVSPTLVDREVKYVLEYEYAIKTPEEQAGVAPGGNRIISVVLDGHFADGANAVASTPVKEFVGDEAKGKTSHTKVEMEFTANGSGEMAIMFYAVTDVDLYLDNVKVYAAK